jgi:hypothetical protein
MQPFEKPCTDLPAGVSPHLDVRLKPGWRFDRLRSALVSETGQSLRLRGRLSTDVRIVPMVPTFADADPNSLSEDERLLGRYLQVLLPPGADPNDMIAKLRALDGVESVSSPPRIGLP